MKKYLWIPFLLWTIMGVHTTAATFEGQTFADQTRLDERDLRLNGLGVRGIFFFKAYVAGLYLGEKTASSQNALQQAGPKRLQLRMLMEIGAPDIKKALIDGMRKNVGEAQWQALQERAGSFASTIDSIGVARPGDSINLDYVPGQGMTLAVNGVVKGAPVAGADFFTALLGIFVGDNPVDTRLKAGLLGQ